MTTTLGQGQICADPHNAIDRLCSVISQKALGFIPAEHMRQYLSGGATAPPTRLHHYRYRRIEP